MLQRHLHVLRGVHRTGVPVRLWLVDDRLMGQVIPRPVIFLLSSRHRERGLQTPPFLSGLGPRQSWYWPRCPPVWYVGWHGRFSAPVSGGCGPGLVVTGLIGSSSAWPQPIAAIPPPLFPICVTLCRLELGFGLARSVFVSRLRRSAVVRSLGPGPLGPPSEWVRWDRGDRGDTSPLRRGLPRGGGCAGPARFALDPLVTCTPGAVKEMLDGGGFRLFASSARAGVVARASASCAIGGGWSTRPGAATGGR